MKTYLKYLLVIFFTIFSFYYTDKVIELSNYNNTILTSINDYSVLFDKKCIEGQINDDGIILGLSGIEVDKNKSYSNMKGIGFKKELIEYNENKCILNKDNNKDKYILGASKYKNSISLVIDLNTFDYLDSIENISKSENVVINYLININGINKINNSGNLLIKTNTDNIKEFKKKIDNFYCTNYDNFDVINYCKKYGFNSIKITNYINDNLLINTKKILDKGIIIFIKESSSNTNELLATIKYIKSRGYNIVSIDNLLS